MKIFFCYVMAIMMMACTKKGAPDIEPGPPPDPIDSSQSTLLYRGQFMNGPFGTTAGNASIYETNGSWTLRLQNFRVNNGPDLKVYLSKEQQPLNFIRLGDLKAINGEQVYEITGMPDVMQYKYALIHCEQYNHLFGWALLMRP